MSNEQIVKPQQKRSIEKKQKLIMAGLKLFFDKGYNATTIADLAKEAGVSVGIVYRYFNDKRDILLEGMEIYIAEFIVKIKCAFDVSTDTSIQEFLKKYIELSHESQDASSLFFNELMAMAYLDKDVAEIFERFDKELKIHFKKAILKLIDIPEFADEKIDMVISLLKENNHKLVYDVNYSDKQKYMMDLAIDTAINIFNYSG